VAHAGIADLDDALAAAQRASRPGAHAAVERSKIMRAPPAAARARRRHRPPADAGAGQAAGRGARPRCAWRRRHHRVVRRGGPRVYGRIVPRARGPAQQVLKEPVGPVAAFTPWNFPINQVVRKLAPRWPPAARSSSRRRRKPRPRRPNWSAPLSTPACPPGVLGLVYGDPAEISNYLIPHPVIRKITFTGSTPVGKQLAALAGQHMKRVTMELGGHAPVIVAEPTPTSPGRQGAAAPSSATPGRCASRPRASWCNAVRERIRRRLRRRARR
jgi:succinate-semialdehyde dehydrogenase/glutarate-semialdehyde dehydrogenase